MIQSIKNIFLGWTNLTLEHLNTLDPIIKDLGETRLLMCDSCTLRSGNTCDPTKKGKVLKDFEYNAFTGVQLRLRGIEYTGCGCNIQAKALAPTSQCPLNKWSNG